MVPTSSSVASHGTSIPWNALQPLGKRCSKLEAEQCYVISKLNLNFLL